jgi:hypothetical protein
LPHEQRGLEARIATFARRKKAEDKVGRTGDCPEDQTQGHHFLIGQQEERFESRMADRLKVQVIVAAAADGWGHATLRRERLADNDVGQMLQEVKAGQRPEWKDNTDRSFFAKITGPNGTP